MTPSFSINNDSVSDVDDAPGTLEYPGHWPEPVAWYVSLGIFLPTLSSIFHPFLHNKPAFHYQWTMPCQCAHIGPWTNTMHTMYNIYKLLIDCGKQVDYVFMEVSKRQCTASIIPLRNKNQSKYLQLIILTWLIPLMLSSILFWQVLKTVVDTQ